MLQNLRNYIQRLLFKRYMSFDEYSNLVYNIDNIMFIHKTTLQNYRNHFDRIRHGLDVL